MLSEVLGLARRVHLVPSHTVPSLVFAPNIRRPFSYQRLAEARAPWFSHEQHGHSCLSRVHNYSERSVVARPPTPSSKKHCTPIRPTTAPTSLGTPEMVRKCAAIGTTKVRSQSATEPEGPVARGVKSTAVKLPDTQLLIDAVETLWWLSRALCRQRLGVDIALLPRREGGDGTINIIVTLP